MIKLTTVNKAVAYSMVRKALSIAGTAAVTYGYMTDSMVADILGVLPVIISVIWAYIFHTTYTTADLPSVQALVGLEVPANKSNKDLSVK